MERFAAGCGVSDRRCAESPTQAGHPCSKLQSILVKAKIFFITLCIDCKEKRLLQVFRLTREGTHQEASYQVLVAYIGKLVA
jgi:hypothetical protein